MEEEIDFEEIVEAAEYQGKKVTLNKPFRTPKESKKFAVYTKNGSGTVVKVRFGDPNMEIKRDSPKEERLSVTDIDALHQAQNGRLGIGLVECGLKLL